MFRVEDMDIVEGAEAVDIGRLRGLRGSGEEESGMATRDELQAVMTGKIWDGWRLDKAVAVVDVERTVVS